MSGWEELKNEREKAFKEALYEDNFKPVYDFLRKHGDGITHHANYTDDDFKIYIYSVAGSEQYKFLNPEDRQLARQKLMEMAEDIHIKEMVTKGQEQREKEEKQKEINPNIQMLDLTSVMSICGLITLGTFLFLPSAWMPFDIEPIRAENGVWLFGIFCLLLGAVLSDLIVDSFKKKRGKDD